MRPRKAFVAFLATLIFTVSTAQAQEQSHPVKMVGLRVHVINVGQAEFILLEFNPAAILIDAGGEDTGDTRDRDRLISYLNTFFKERKDIKRKIYSLIISRPHIDHTRLIMDVTEANSSGRYVDPGSRIAPR